MLWRSPARPWSRMNKKEAGCLVQSSAFAGIFGLDLFTDPFAGLCLCPFFTWACSPFITHFYHTFGPTKWTLMTHTAMSFHPSWTLIVSGY